MLFLISCTPTPVDDQVTVKDGTNAKLVFTSSDSNSLGTLAVGSTRSHLIKISNEGNLDASEMIFAIVGNKNMNYTGDAFPGLSGTCTDTLVSGDSCYVEVFVFSNFPAVIAENLFIEYKDGIGDNSTTYQLSGNFGSPGNLAPSLSGLHFGNLQVGATKTLQVSVQNIGNLPVTELDGYTLTIDGTPGDFYFSGGSYPGTGGDCATYLAPGQSCTLEVEAHASILEFEHTGTLELTFKNPSQYQSISIGLGFYGADIKGYLEAEVLGSGALYTTAINNAAAETQPVLTYSLTNTGYLATKAMDLDSSGALPLVVSDNRCPAELAPFESCEIDLMLKPEYGYPLADGIEFPLIINEEPIVFKYDNNKDAQLQLTPEILAAGSVLGEANLTIYPNSNTLEPFDNDIVPLDKTARWNDYDWNYIVGTAALSRKILFKNGSPGKNAKMTNVEFSLSPSDGSLKLNCLENGNCPEIIHDGQKTEMTFSYSPTAPEDKSADPYILTVSYFDGVKNKVFKVEIPTVATSYPYLSIEETYLDDDGVTYFAENSTMTNFVTSSSIVIKNEGLSGVNIAQNIIRSTGQTGEEYFTYDNSDCDRLIKNSETCTLRFDFLKPGDPRAKPFVAESFTNSFKVSNGVAVGNEAYQIFDLEYRVSMFERGWYDFAPEVVDFGEVLYSTIDQSPIGQVNNYTRVVGVPNSSVKGSHIRNHFTFEIVGDEASHFSYSRGFQSELWPTGEDGGLSYRTLNIIYTAPVQAEDLGADGESTAQLIIRYHGMGQDTSSTDYEPETIIYNLKAKPVIEPKYRISKLTNRKPFAPQLYDPDAALMIADVENVAHTIIKVTNYGLIDKLGTTNALFKSIVSYNAGDDTEDPTIDTHFKLRAVNPSDTCFNSLSQIDHQSIEFTIKPLQSCEFEIYDYAPDYFGFTEEVLKVEFEKTNGVGRDYEKFRGVGFNLAKLRFNPFKTGVLNFVKFNEIDLGQVDNQEFLIQSAIGTPFVVPGEVTSLEVVSDITGIIECEKALTLPANWSGKEIVFKPESFSINTESCSGVRIHPGEDDTSYFTNYSESCPLSIDFSPSHVGKVEKACVAVNYKVNESATSPIGTSYAIVAGSGKVPKSVFHGWRGAYAEGETLEVAAHAKIVWNEMTVVDDLGTVTGYKIFRKNIKEGTFSDEHIFEGALADFYNEDTGFYEYSNHVGDSLPNGSTVTALEVDKVFNYKVQAIISIPGEGTFDSPTDISNGNADHVASLVIPGPYMSLIHRWTANIDICTKNLQYDYEDLDRSDNYSCVYSGPNNSNGSFDVKDYTIIDRYEVGKSNSDGKPSNVPNLPPYLFESLSQAKDYCDSQQYSIFDLNIYNEEKSLMNRLDYIIGSIGTDPMNCVTSGAMQNSGVSSCESSYGLNDMVGNAWEMLDDTLLPAPGNSWVYDENSFYAGDEYYFNVSELNLNNYIGSDYDTFIDFFKFDASVSCFNTLFNEPRYSLGGICATAKSDVLMDDAYNGPMQDFAAVNTAVIFPKYESELGSAFTLKRTLMMGGSNSSAQRFNVSPSKYVMYWTNPETERILMAQHPNGQYEGGALRCTFKFSME
ncbi:choice-of-anchor D domain-containing protein [Halobacteriovorax sp. ZH3_bin.1]|uniref:choice-of-anchor D domain-containing protein n=1 Tax=Halobacteriovorax sp. ZH3_bin.1 TaxID=3157725 RepID=UPI003719B6FF